MSNTVQVKKGKQGWGGPLILKKTDELKYVVSVTGGGVHPVAKKIAELTGAKAIDSFKDPVPKEETMVAVIDCGGTARCGTYPRIGIPTINVKVMSPSGPLSKFMTEDIFISGVSINDIELLNEDSSEKEESIVDENENEEKDIHTKIKEAKEEQNDEEEVTKNKFMLAIDSIAKGAGKFMNIMYQSGRDTIDTVIKNIIPFMAFVATLIGIINYTGIGDIIANVLSPLSNNIVGLIILAFITGLPFLSPLLAPGAVIGAIIGTLIGNEIASGNIEMSIALPALFAINAQVGCDFIPVGLTLGEAKPETISVAAPAVLFSRTITGPLAVLIAYGMSFLL
ncbi:PTS glucitol/sorbitol transporter subunit IIB [Staphylococcus lentus]|uniref:PTS glucitol/sorbitol transporter subunit IIB n=1 Tax=Mammaliicoccus lentus TaxID=42858 RepID=UPI001883C88C|nr:PTS glucitol/sorbitol transporter subunit IIB [Mammaliicoccus lentus]MBF0840904.1 PTS glucitol/sorbitol transporter subunit IIB [Mammaliicoccus lentus]